MGKGLLIVMSGPSGTGKGTVCRVLCNRNPQIHYSISATTRPPRRGEIEGVSYFFLAENEFTRLRREGALLEWAEVYGNFYGTPLEKVEEVRNRGQDVLLEIDTQGAMKVKTNYSEGVFIFLLPPSMDELWRRIRGRGTDSLDVIKKRFAAAHRELNEVWNYDYTVLNEKDRVINAVECIEAIIKAEKCQVSRNKDILDKLFKEGECIDLPVD